MNKMLGFLIVHRLFSLKAHFESTIKINIFINLNHIKMIRKTALGILILIGFISKSQLLPPSTYVRPNIDWVAYYNQRSSIANAASALDANSNVYLTGYATPSGTANANMIVLKYDSMGVMQFSVAYNNGGYDCGNAIRIDAAGNTYVAGASSGTAGTAMDIVAAKYSPTGSNLWLIRWDGGVGGIDEAIDIKLDVNGDVYVLGRSQNGSGDFDVKILKLNGSNGSVIWQQSNNPYGLNDEGVGMVISSNNQRVIVTGNITDPSNGTDIAIFTLDATTGSLGWNNVINGSSNGNDKAKGIILSGANVVVCGEIANSSTDYVTAKYAISTGSQIFQTTYDFSGTPDRATALVKDSTGNIGVTGLVLDNSIYSYHTVLYDSTGTQLWVNAENTALGVTNVDPKIACDSIAHHFYVCGEIMKSTKDVLAYQISPNGNTSWKETFDSQNVDVDAATNLVVNGIGVVYLSALCKNSSADYDITTIKISQTPVYFPPDFNNEPSSHAFLFYQNKGQLVDMSDSLIPEINFYTTSYPEMYFDNNSIKYVFTRFDTVVSTVDTASRVDLTFLEANPFAKPYPYYETQGNLNYYLGHCPNGITDVKGYERSITPNIYPGIDLHYYSNENGLKYYFVVKPGADPNNIILQYSGAVSTATNGSGKLIVDAGLGTIESDAPIAYQVGLTGTVVSIIPITGWSAYYASLGSDMYKFGLGTYTTALPLVIEVGKATGTVASLYTYPEWGTYYGGGKDDKAEDITTDAAGNLYATGSAGNSTYPTLVGQGTYSANFAGGYSDAFITKFSSTYTRLFTTFYGGNDYDWGHGITYDALNNKIYICGATVSGTTFPTVALPGSANSFVDITSSTSSFLGKGFILRFNASSLAREWATKFGGNGETPLEKIKADASGNIYVVGTAGFSSYSQTCSPVSSGALPLCNPGGGAYFQSVNKSANYGTNTDNYFYQDCYIGKFNSNTQLVWSTLFGGQGDDYIGNLAIDDANQKLYIIGSTKSLRVGSPVCSYTANGSFPLCNSGGGYFQPDLNVTNVNNTLDGFVTKFSLGGALEHSTFFGGSAEDGGHGILVDNSGNVFITGYTATNFYGNNNCSLSTNGGFPFCPASSYTQTFSGSYDAYITKFDNALNMGWSTFYGGVDQESAIIKGGELKLALNKGNNDVYVVGNTRSCTGFGLTNDPNFFYQGGHADGPSCTLQPTDAFILGFDNAGVRNMSTYFGGKGVLANTLPQEGDFIMSVATVGNRVYVCGKTYATSVFPLYQPFTGNPYYQGVTTVNASYSDAFYAQLRKNSSVTGINELESSKGKLGNLKLFPNPAANLLYLEWYNNSPSNVKAQIYVYNIMGQLLQQFEASQSFGLNTGNIKLESLSPGVYITIIKTGNQSLNAKFIKE